MSHPAHVAPDRLSVFVGDPGHAPYEALGERGHSIRIYLDGVEQQNVMTADRAQGWLRRLAMIEGRAVRFESAHVKTEVVRGKIEFYFGERCAP